MGELREEGHGTASGTLLPCLLWPRGIGKHGSKEKSVMGSPDVTGRVNKERFAYHVLSDTYIFFPTTGIFIGISCF